MSSFKPPIRFLTKLKVKMTLTHDIHSGYWNRSQKSAHRHGCSSEPSRYGVSYPGVPFVAAVFPEATLAVPDQVESVGDFDSHQILGVFVSELPLDPQAQRSTVFDRQRLAIECIGQYRLRMKRIDQIDGFVIAPGAFVAALLRFAVQGIGAMKDRVASLRFEPRGAQQQRQGNPGPPADRAPAFDAVMARDLSPSREFAQFLETVARRLSDESIDSQTPVRKAAGEQYLVLRISRHRGTIRPEDRRPIFLGVLARQGLAAQEQPLAAHRQGFGAIQDPAKRRRTAESVASSDRQGAETHRGAYHKSAARQENSAHDSRLHVDRVSARQHRTQFVPHADREQRAQMHDDEQHQQIRSDEMQRSGRLAASEQIEQEWRRSIDSRRHRESRQHGERSDQEHDAGVGDFLQRIVVARGFAPWKLQLQVMPEFGCQSPRMQLRPAWNEVLPQMPREQPADQINEPVDDQNPSEEKVPAPAGCQIAVARHRDPARERGRRSLRRHMKPALRSREPRLAPVERRMGIQYL